MSMITCIVIDDEKRARETFALLLERYFTEKIKLLYSAESVQEGVNAINKFNPELVFLDIEMPVENGFKLFEYFDHIHFEVIFLTAHIHYSIEAIKVAAFDYLLKPLNYIDLTDCINRYEKQKRAMRINPERVYTLLNSLNAGNDIGSKIALPTHSGYHLEKISHILYCEADENYTKVYTIRGDYFVVPKTLKTIEELLPKDIFFRIHKSWLINLNYVQDYHRNDGYKVLLENGVELDVATRRNEEFLRILTKRSLFGD